MRYFYVGKHNVPTTAKRKITLLVTAIAVTIFTIVSVIETPRVATAADYTTPIRAMFYYPWFPQTWHSNDHYAPSLGNYSSDNPAITAAHVSAMKYAGMQAMIASWWGQGQQNEAVRFPILYGAAAAQNFGVMPYYEPEGQGDVPIAQIQSDLAYLRAYADSHPGAAVRIGGKLAIFVYNAGSTGCGEVTKWKTATNGFADFYINMKVFSGFATCADQPSSWHQYGPASAQASHLPYSFNISPGFWHHNEASPRLVRDPARWAANVSNLKASGAQWQLVTSFNEWGEATSVEPSPSWQSNSGWGYYLDELRRQLVNGTTPSPSPSPSVSASPSTSPSPTVSPTPTSSPSPSVTPTPSPTPSPSVPGSITVMAAGDIVDSQPCNGYVSGCQDGWTAELITKYNPVGILALGDNQYEEGTLAQFNAGWGRTTCAAPTDCDAWGKHLSHMYPAPGNHEWLTANAQGYRDYFGPRLAAIGSDTPSPNQMYYSFDIGAWHFISLDSDCSKVGGCNAGNPQMTWLLSDLDANNGRPTIVYYHHATWSSGNHGSSSSHTYLKTVLVGDIDVQIVLAGHDHEYERFAPMGISGPDPTGPRYFVVGTGGKGAVCGGAPIAGTIVKNCTTMGMLRLILNGTGYTWQFHAAAEVGGPASTFTDLGTSTLR